MDVGHNQTTMKCAHYSPGEHEAEWVERAFAGSESDVNLLSAVSNSDQL